MAEQSKITLREVPKQIPLNEIFENPRNPRKYFDEIGIQELAENIKEVGLLQPIRVRPVNGEFQIVHGHRRYRAVKLLEWETILATVATMTEQEAYEISLSENLLRDNLSAIEEAEGFQHLIDEYSYNQQEVGRKFGKSQQFISSRLVLLKLPESVQEKITTRVIKASHGELLAKIDDTELQIELADEIVQDGLSVREIERRIKDSTSEQSTKQTEPFTIDEAKADRKTTEPRESTEEPESASDETETLKKSEAEEDEQLTLKAPEGEGKKTDITEPQNDEAIADLEAEAEASPQLELESGKKETKGTYSSSSELLTLACLNEPLRAEFQKNLARLNEYTHQVSRQENVDKAIGICGEIKAVALSMKETLEKSKAA